MDLSSTLLYNPCTPFNRVLGQMKLKKGGLKGDFHLLLLVFPFVYHFNSRIVALVCFSFGND